MNQDILHNTLRRVGPRENRAPCSDAPVGLYEHQTSSYGEAGLGQDAIDNALGNNAPSSLRKLFELHIREMHRLQHDYKKEDVNEQEVVMYTALEVHFMRNEVVRRINWLQPVAARLLPLYRPYSPDLLQAVGKINDVFDQAEPGNFTLEDADKLRSIMSSHDIGTRGGQRVCSRLLMAFAGRIFTAMEANIAGTNFTDRADVRSVLASCVGAFGLERPEEAYNFMNFLDAGLDAARFERALPD